MPEHVFHLGDIVKARKPWRWKHQDTQEGGCGIGIVIYVCGSASFFEFHVKWLPDAHCAYYDTEDLVYCGHIDISWDSYGSREEYDF